jgi:hypothetical protein
MLMRKRYIYLSIFGIPGFLISLAISFTLIGVLAGFSWLYLFGDNPWPAWSQTAGSVIFIIVFLLCWIASLVIGFKFGARREDGSPVNKKHIVVSMAVMLATFALVLLHQLRVGNIGPKSLDLQCSDLCKEKGYSGSSMPPRNSGDTTCRCYDAANRKWIDAR